MKKSFLILAALVAVYQPVKSFASDQDFILVNKTGYQIDEVYVSKHSSADWEDDVMGKDSLDVGEQVKISFPNRQRGCNYDLKVNYHDGDTAQWGNINLCEVSKVTIFWNKKTQESRAVTE